MTSKLRLSGARSHILASATLLLGMGGTALASEILFVGNSFTHGKYDPVLGYNAGPGDGSDPNVVHDLMCPSLPCTGSEAPPHVNPTSANTPGATVADKLNYLNSNPSSQYKEVGLREADARPVGVSARYIMSSWLPLRQISFMPAA
jgi:hypothetical protein